MLSFRVRLLFRQSLDSQLGKRRFPPLRVWVLVGVFLAIIIWYRRPNKPDVPEVDPVNMLLVSPDAAVANIVTLIMSFCIGMTLLIWYSFRSGFSRTARMTPWIVGTLGIVAFALTFRIQHVSGDLVPSFAPRWSPRPDERLESPGTAAAATDSPRVDLMTTTAADFAQFLGPSRSAAVEGVSLARDWDRQPPQRLWRQKIGAGWSGFAAVNGFAVTVEQRDELEIVSCYDVLTGELMWAHSIETRHATLFGEDGPRATPTIDQGKVYSVGATGVVLCLDGATGAPIWRRNLQRQYGLTQEQDEENVQWGRSGSPLIVGELVVVPAGGPAERPVSLVAFDKHSGETVWEGGARQISYASPALATIAGTEQILIVLEDHLAGFDLESGELLWEYPWEGKSNANASASQAVAVAGDRVFVSKGYGVGSLLLQLSRAADGTWQSTPLWHSTVMKTKFSNVAIFEDHVYGLDDRILSCIELSTGQRKWKGGRYKFGQVLRVGDLLLVQAESGEVALVEATPERFHELSRFPAIAGKTWNNPCLYGRHLLVRNAEEAACYKLPLAGE